jgi:hypothetical protein
VRLLGVDLRTVLKLTRMWLESHVVKRMGNLMVEFFQAILYEQSANN